MKKLHLLTLLSLICISLFGQQSKIDSLLLLNKESKLDSLKLKYLNEITTYYQKKNNLELATKYSDSLHIYSEILGLTTFELLSLTQKGIIEFRKADYKKAVSFWRKGLTHTKIESYPIQQSNLCNNIAVGYSVLGKKDSIFFYMLKAIELNKKNNNKESLVGNYHSLADAYINFFLYNEAIKYANELQSIALKKDNEIALAKSYSLLAKISTQEYDFVGAEKLYDKAFEIFKRLKPDDLIMLRGLSFLSLTSTYDDKRYSEALKGFLNLKKTYSKKLNDKNFDLYLNAYILNCYNELEITENSLEIYNSIKKSLNESINLTPNRKAVVANCLSTREIIRKEVNKKTLTRLVNSFYKSNGQPDLKIKSTTYKNISDYYYLQANFTKSYLNLKEHIILEDSINKKRTSVINLSLKRKFNEELKEKENLKLKADNIEQELLTQKANTRNWILLISLLGLGISAILIWKRYQSESKAKKIISEQKDDIEIRKNTIENLQKELHHRVKNNLAIIDTFIEVAKEEFNNIKFDTKLTEIQNRIVSINEIHKQLYQNSDVTNLDIKNYIYVLSKNVSQSFTNKKITLQNNIENINLNADTSFPVGLIINEFLTNSYKHAFEKEGNIIIEMKDKGQEYLLTLSDNGKGLPKDFDIEKTETFGLRIVQLLTKQIDGIFNLESINGVQLTIQIPKV